MREMQASGKRFPDFAKSTISLPFAGYMNHHPFLHFLSVTDSTNNHAMGCWKAGHARHGEAWFTDHQTAGKGQRERRWHAEPGSNLAFTVVLEPDAMAIDHPFSLSARLALAFRDTVADLILENVNIKWPNDLFIHDRKAGGVLVENVYRGLEWRVAIAGMGLNVNQTDFGFLGSRAVSLRQHTRATYDVARLAELLHDQVMGRFGADPQPYNRTLDEFNQRLYRRGQKQRIRIGSEVREVSIIGVDEEGCLLTDGGRFRNGDLDWVLEDTVE